MKFRKSSARTSPKMELLYRPPSSGNRISNFKRSKSLRASVKLITKMRNHSNAEVPEVENIRPIPYNTDTCNGFQSSAQNSVNFSFKYLDEHVTSSRNLKSNEYEVKREDAFVYEESDETVEKLNVQLSNLNCAAESNAYENPTFMDSSADSSMSSFFHMDNKADRSNELNVTGDALPSPHPKSNIATTEAVKNGLTIIVDEKMCNKYNLYACRREPSFTKEKKKFDDYQSWGENTKKAKCNKKCGGKSSFLLQHPSKVERSTFFCSKDKNNEYVRILEKHRSKSKEESASSSVTASSKRKGKSHWKGFITEEKARLFVGDAKETSTSTSSLGAKLYSLQRMEFLESFSKKKQQQKHQLSNLTSVNTNPLLAQPAIDIHLHALFAAIEHGHVEKAKAILESTDVDINSVNSDNLSPLDVAVLNNNRPLATMLLTFGAQEGNRFKAVDSVGGHLSLLLAEAERRVQEFSGGSSGGISANSVGALLLEPPSYQSHRASFSYQHNNLTGCGGSAEDKQLVFWERRARALRKMLFGFDQARPPDMSFLVTIDVISTTSVVARFQESEEMQEATVCTKFKIQWSTREDFGVVCAERELFDMKLKECRIDNLHQGQKYYFRAAAGNLKGYSRFRPTAPAHVTPGWRDVDGRLARFTGRLEQLDSLFSDVRGGEYCQETPAVQRRNHKKKTTIKQLFTATSKFQKNLRRGLFFSCLLYYEDKVLVTNEDFLPVIEVDETYPSCFINDFHWLMKVSCAWDDIKSLRQDMEKSHNSSTNHFRIKLLQAASQMQAALCIQNLGQLYHKLIKDVHGTLVISTVNHVKSPKLVSVLNSRWLPVSKVTKKFITHDDSNVADILMASILDQMAYHHVSSVKLSRGLYLGYLKMQSSVDSIKIVVPAKSPNVLPHCKIRDNPHVSAEEWEYFKKMARMQSATDQCAEDEEKKNVSNELQGSEQQQLFIDMVAGTVKRLFNYMDIGSDEMLKHRLYDLEVIDLSDDVSFLVAVPPAEIACSVPGTREILLQRGDLLSLPIQVFEMIHLNTYQKEVTSRYARLSCVLELDTAQAQHNQREAFSTSELTVAKDKLARLQDLQTQMNNVWKGSRWLIDVITFARDRSTTSQPLAGISMKYLLSLDRNKNSSSGNGLKRSLLQLPPRDPKLVKSSPGRGSWPGPSVTNLSCSSQMNLLSAELSKSEQQLPLGSYPRKGSNSSNCSSSSEPYKSSARGQSSDNLTPMPDSGGAYVARLPPSKSEDTLVKGTTTHKHHRQHKKDAVSASSSPLLGVLDRGGAPSNVASSSSSIAGRCSATMSGSLHSVSSGASDEHASAKPARSKASKSVASVAAIASDKQQVQQAEDDSALMPAPLPGILQVYTAYETGLASGTSLKLHVTPRTTAREVVDLVVKQLNMAVLLKGLEGPVYAAEELSNFCLVAVIGARERCLRDDFKPLQLQNPWKKGRLYVRQKQDVLAALEHSSKHTAYL